MELTGKVFKIGELETGEGKNGTWKKLQVVVETNLDTKYPKKVALTLMADLTNYDLKEGETKIFLYDIESREFNSKWYTDVKVWKINNSSE